MNLILGSASRVPAPHRASGLLGREAGEGTGSRLEGCRTFSPGAGKSDRPPMLGTQRAPWLPRTRQMGFTRVHFSGLLKPYKKKRERIEHLLCVPYIPLVIQFFSVCASSTHCVARHPGGNDKYGISEYSQCPHDRGVSLLCFKNLFYFEIML